VDLQLSLLPERRVHGRDVRVTRDIAHELLVITALWLECEDASSGEAVREVDGGKADVGAGVDDHARGP
jgi:hypothetical protein